MNYWKLFVVALLTVFPLQLKAAFQLPPMQEVRLDNGLKIVLIPQTEVPLVHVTVAIRAGSVNDGKAWGLASLTSAGLNLGTQSYSKKQIEDLIDQNGFDLETGISKEYLTVDMSGASEDSGKLLKLMSELVRVPKFPAAEVDKLRARSVSQLRKEKESPNQIGTEVFERLYFKNHPYGSPDNGVVESLSKLKANDLQGFHKAYFEPQMTLVAIAGDFKPAEMQALITKEFGSWKKGGAVPAAIATPAEGPSATEVIILDKPDARETTFRIGGKGTTHLNPDWAKMSVINTVLGGRFTSLLNDALRVKSGYTYGARSSFREFRSSGTFYISTFTANDTTFNTLDLGLETYRSFLKQGIDQKTLDSAKAYVKGQFPPQYETLQSLTSLATELFVYGLGVETYNSFEKVVDALTVEEANALIRSRFPSDKLVIMMIGKASDIAAKAKNYGPVRQLPLTRIDQAIVL